MLTESCDFDLFKNQDFSKILSNHLSKTYPLQIDIDQKNQDLQNPIYSNFPQEWSIIIKKKKQSKPSDPSF